MKRLKSNKKGFTLIEMIVVIVIIAILVALAVPRVMSYVEDARDSKFLASTRIVFNEIDLKTTEVIGQFGIFENSSTSTEKKLSGIINEYYFKEENLVSVGDYTMASTLVSPHYDYNELERFKFDRTKDQHELTKIGVAFVKQDGKSVSYVFVVIKRNGEAKVFHDKYGSGETFDKNSEWYIEWSGH